MKHASIFLLIALASAVQAEDDAGWDVVSESPALSVYKRTKKDSSVLEYKAVGLIDSAPGVVRRVIDDTEEFPHFMPYCAEARVISSKGDSNVCYQRISAPLVGDRDYTIQVTRETTRAPDGSLRYCNKWVLANDLGPAEKTGVVRIKINSGSWLLEPSRDGKQTRATYIIFSDPGGSLPAMVVNAANKSAIQKVYEAIRKQARQEKYTRQGG